MGLPLGVMLADRGASVALFDINADVVEQVAAGSIPFHEPGLSDVLNRVRTTDRLD